MREDVFNVVFSCSSGSIFFPLDRSMFQVKGPRGSRETKGILILYTLHNKMLIGYGFHLTNT
jgi:hypothetical protein